MRKDADDWVGTARPPAPAAALRERVLAAARAVWPRSAREVGVVDRIWESRGVRWAWVLLVSALLLGHVVVSGPGKQDLPVASAARRSTPEFGSDEMAPPVFGLPWAKPRPEASRLRLIDVMLDPGVARSLLEEAP
jgi:hypothetical protein